MKWNQALIQTSVFSYVAAAVLGALGTPSMEGLPTPAQAILFGLFGILLSLTLSNPYVDLKALRGAMAILYGLLATMSFLGVQKWINYHGTTSLGPWMALWDLALAIALLTLDGD